VNYRHVFHAGNFADVVKHVVLARVLVRMSAKAKPLRYLETHAGIGLYDLDHPDALRTGEARAGVERVLAAPALPTVLAPWVDAVRALNPDGPLRRYPGSPALAAMLLRPDDRLVLAELHEEDAGTLRRTMAGDARVAVHHMDGWLATKAHLPPRERRGVVLVDPPFEAPDEFDRMVRTLVQGHRRFPQGVFVLWYPIKERPAVWRFQEAVVATGLRDVLLAEATIWPEDTHRRLNGCGLLVVNPPYGLAGDLEVALPAIHAALATGHGGARIGTLVPE
jgi:23S rRNA (adenine2030-N6)-methyltransferase